jgi:hypothetical protein
MILRRFPKSKILLLQLLTDMIGYHRFYSDVLPIRARPFYIIKYFRPYLKHYSTRLFALKVLMVVLSIACSTAEA